MIEPVPDHYMEKAQVFYVNEFLYIYFYYLLFFL